MSDNSCSNNNQATPAMSQYFEIKSKYKDSILFFRMGDFYEMFGDDAVVASKILGITLTARNKNSKNPVPLCGLPYHAYLPYLIKLLKAGKKVAICEQLEDAKEAIGVVKRGVTRIVTPATVVEEEGIENFDNNFLLSLYVEIPYIYIAAVDVSTGEIYLTYMPFDKADEASASWKAQEAISNMDIDIGDINVQTRNTSKNYNLALGRVLQHYGVTSEKSLHIENKGFIFAIDMVLDYFDDLILRTKLKRPVMLSDKDRLIIDRVAAKTLEITESNDGNNHNTLFSIMNYTSTPMGSRFLKNALLRPLRSEFEINKRLNRVEYFVKNPDFLNSLIALLNEIHDIERITSRLISGRAMPKDLIWLKLSLKNVPEIIAMIKNAGEEFKQFTPEYDDDLIKTIEKSINDNPPVTIKEGGIIKDGYNESIDNLRNIKTHSNEIIASIEKKEREASGINQLKIGCNKVFGYFIEISKTNVHKVPPYFIRKQTLTTGERFVTQELKDLESKILSADESLKELEYELFIKIRKYTAEQSEQLREISSFIAEIDFICSMAKAAIKSKYIKPIMNNSGRMIIKDGRHPVVENNNNTAFVPNNYNLDEKENRLMIITGPNMSGKSTYLRSAALIAIMAHTGSFVPASYAEIGIIDRIFTRIGASDNLSKGESTFMVEMVETANILTNATKNSLIILDEIGRGTSTFDGISIAWSAAEYILNKIGAKTLFATHYHELTNIAAKGGGAKNYTMEVQEWDNEVIFLKKIIEGTADKSYGIYVGKLAGLPEEVTKRAENVLKQLENKELNISDNNIKTERKKEKIIQPILVFDDSHPVIDELKKLDTDNLTPIQSLQIINELKQKAYL